MTNGEFVSLIVNSLKHITKDDHISRRYILHVGQAESQFLLTQKLLDKTILREDNIFRTISCLQMEKIDVIKCGIYEFERCKSLMRSKYKLPKPIYSRYGASIVEVTNIDGSVTFLPTSLQDFNLFKKRRSFGGKKFKFYYVQDGYLYLPDSEIEAVNVTLLTLDDEEVKKLSGCGGEDSSTTSSATGDCGSVWDAEFVCSDKLLSAVIAQTLQKVSVGRQILQDERPDLDSNIKTYGGTSQA